MQSRHGLPGWFGVGHALEHFPDEQGVPLGLAMDCCEERVGRPGPGRDLHEPGHVTLTEAPQRDRLGEASPIELPQGSGKGVRGGQSLVVRSDDQEAGVAELGGEELQQQQRRCVRRVEVIEDDHHRPLSGCILQQPGDGVEKAETCLPGIEQ